MESREKVKQSTAYKCLRRKFMKWVIRWSADDDQPEEEQTANPPDIGDLVNILRSVGFKLRHFDNSGGRDQSMSASVTSLNSASDINKNAECRVEITCGNSGLKAILDCVLRECRCPSMECATEAQFWQVSGSAPVSKGASQESLNSIQEAGSSLIPPLAAPLSVAVKDIMMQLLQIITESDLNSSRLSLSGNPRLSTGSNRSHHRSLDTLTLPHSSSKQYGSASEMYDAVEQENRTLFARALSNLELTTWSVSPVAGDSNRKLSFNSTSPTSKLSTSLQKITLSEKSGIYSRLEVAMNSINDAMCMLQSQTLNIQEKRKTELNNSTPNPHARKSAQIKKSSGTPSKIKRLAITPEQAKKSQGTQNVFKKSSSVTPTVFRKPAAMQNTSRPLSATPKKSSGTPGATKTKAVSTSSLHQAHASYTVTRPKTPHNEKSSAKSSRPYKYTPRPGRVPDKTSQISQDTIADMSAESSSSASSASSTKARKLFNVVRRASRLSSK